VAKGFDAANPLTASTAASFKANKYEFVARYLVPVRYRKALTKAEADIIQAAGMKIVSVFETTADRALAGYQAGLRDGLTAKQCAADVGQPEGSCIYFAVDFDPEPGQMQSVIDYIKGCNDATPKLSTGVYGSFDVVTAVKAAGAASHLWQTYAWSGKNLADCQIFQWENGEQYDEDKSYGCEGWWGEAPAVPLAPVQTKLDPGVALTVINTWMKPSFDATTDQTQKGYIHWLANMLRDAAGLEQEND
jgi:hypothetical protein